ncbi:MAG TPA: YIP1 family protein [Dehalococcoidia bacterium]|nr:YIP1 family protein [Dehalococcoidia bacterium]
MRSFQTHNLPTVSSWVRRILRFDFGVFAEIRSEASATTPAILTVLAASLLAGFGSWIWAVEQSQLDGEEGEVFVKSLVMGGLLQLLAWFLWVYVAYQVLARVYRIHTNFYELVRVMGFAFLPVGLSILIAIDSLAVPIGVIGWAIAVLTTNAALQTATAADSQQATVANITGFALFAIVMGFLANVGEVKGVGGLAPGLFFFALDF